MIQTRRFILCCLLLVFSLQMGVSQKKYYGLTKHEIKKLSTVELSKGIKKFPESYLYGMQGSNLILLSDISDWTQTPLFVKSKVSIEGYDKLIISSPEDRRKKSLLWGAIIGGVSYAIAQKATATKTSERTISARLINQTPANGQIEGLIAGVTGFGLGMIIGQMLSKRKINLLKQKRRALNTLREFTYQ